MKQMIILVCSKSKIWDKDKSKRKVEAKNAYTGYVFIHGKKYAEKHKLPYLIISAKYGVLKPNKMISKYDKKLKTKKDVLKIRNKFNKFIDDLFSRYDKIFLIGGNRYYRMVFKGFNDSKFYYIKAENQADLRIKAKNLVEK